MCQQAIQGTGDISITTSDTVYNINILISRLLYETVCNRIIDAGTEGMNLRRMYDTLRSCHYTNRIVFCKASHHILHCAFLAKGKSGCVF